MLTTFFLVLSLMTSPRRYELTAAISGNTDGWIGRTRHFKTLDEVETALRKAEVVAQVGPNLSLNAAASNIPVAFALASAAPAIALGLLNRVDPKTKFETTMVTFHDLNGGLLSETAHYEQEHPIAVGDLLKVDTPAGERIVEVLAITRNEVLPFGANNTRRHMTIDVRF